MTAPFASPRLIADVGGTFARFALETAPGRFGHAASLPCADHPDFQSAVLAYLGTLPQPSIEHAAVAIANPVEGDRVRMTNYHWEFSIEQMRARLGLQTLVVVNDFTALALAIPQLRPVHRRQVGPGAPVARSVVGVIGAGSGLGVSGLIPAGDGWVALGTEGGHASFSPRDERELDILRYAMTQFDHVSFERLVSGPGLELTYRALRLRAKRAVDALPAPEITRRALGEGDPVCLETLQAFCAMLGTAASNLAVTQGALGGVFIGGGIVPRLGSWFDVSPFRARFEDKGRFSNYLKAIPTYVITAKHATLEGASAVLASQLRELGNGAGSAILDQIQRAMPSLSPAERRVAQHVLARARSALNDPIADIARAAGVSQPTVIRFCRSLGCEGLSDFKLRLASGLRGTVPVTHTQVTGEDTMLELGVKVLGNTASAILQVREQLNRDTIDRAVDLLSTANRVDFYGVGHDRVVADDAQLKFLRLGVSSGSFTDARMLLLAAQALKPNDVAVIISSGAQTEDLPAVADAAHARGASVLAIAPSHSALARKAEVSLMVDHPENLSTHLPMVSRILNLLVVDILAVGVAMRRGTDSTSVIAGIPAPEAAAGDAAAPVEGARRAGLGVRAAGPLANLTSHSR